MDINFLREIGEIKRFKAGDFIFYEGNIEKSIYFLIKGKVRVFVGCFGIAPVEIAILNPGSFFGEMALLNDSPRSASVCALEEDTIVIEVTKKNFYLLMTHQDDMGYKILSTLVRRVKASIEKLPPDSQFIMQLQQHEYYPLIVTEDEEMIKELIISKQYDVTKILSYYSQLLSEIDVQVTKYNEMCKCNLSQYIDIIPKAHKVYDLEAPKDYKKYILEKEMKCPVCGESSVHSVLRQSLLKLESITKDMRNIYSPIDPTWFEMATCPNCLYTNYASQFEKLPDKYIEQTKKVLQQMEPVKLLLDLESLNINVVFVKYFLAILCTTNPYLKDFKLGRIWLNLAWLYSDVGDMALYQTAYEEAAKYYYKIYVGSSMELSSSEEQKLYMIVAAFMCYEHKYREAQKLYFDVTRIRGGNRMIEDIARDQLEAMKAMVVKGE